MRVNSRTATFADWAPRITPTPRSRTSVMTDKEFPKYAMTNRKRLRGTRPVGPSRAADNLLGQLRTKVDADLKDEQSSEEIAVQLAAVQSATGKRGSPALHKLKSSLRFDRSIPWPAALSWDAALAYSALSPTQLRRSERDGLIRFRKIGPNGSKIAIRQDIDRHLMRLFEPLAGDIETDFDFG